MLRIIKTQILVNVREKSAIFWTLIFPVIMATLFHFALAGIKNVEGMGQILVAVVHEGQEKGQEEDLFLTYLKAFEKEGIQTEIISQGQAQKKLENDKIQGIYYNGSKKKLVVGDDSITSSILGQILDAYVKNEYMIQKIAQDHPENIEKAIEALKGYESVTKQVSMGRKSTDVSQTYYYALVAMACLYGSFLGMYNTVFIQGNTSALGARVCAGCVKRWKSILGSLLSAWILNYGEVLILLFYMQVVLKDINITGEAGKILLLCAVSCFCTSNLGLLTGTCGKLDENTKAGVLIAMSMLWSFLADLMIQGVKYAVEEKIPILNRLNPAVLISDGFYSLLVYEDSRRYMKSIAGLALIGGLFLTAAVLSMRRMRYESI